MSAALVALFAPYCQGASRGALLERALEWMASGQLRGERRLQPEGSRPFSLSWQAGVAPLEPAAVQLLVPPQADYRFTLPTYQLVLWLMDWLEAGGNESTPADLPNSFWYWLLMGQAPESLRP